MPARKPVRFAARETMQRFNYDPLEVLVQRSQDEAVSGEEKRDIAMFLTPYMYPKLANVIIEGELETSKNTDQAELMRRVMENPELADAAQRLSLAAAEIAIEKSESQLVQ